VQPAPAFQHNRFAVVVGRVINLEEALGASFVVDNRTVAFCEACRRQHQMRMVHNRRALMVNNHHQRRFIQRGIYATGRSMTMQIVFQHDNRISGAGFQFGQRVIQRTAAIIPRPTLLVERAIMVIPTSAPRPFSAFATLAAA
jgi:hypothetical protein